MWEMLKMTNIMGYVCENKHALDEFTKLVCHGKVPSLHCLQAVANIIWPSLHHRRSQPTHPCVFLTACVIKFHSVRPVSGLAIQPSAWFPAGPRSPASSDNVPQYRNQLRGAACADTQGTESLGRSRSLRGGCCRSWGTWRRCSVGNLTCVRSRDT